MALLANRSVLRLVEFMSPKIASSIGCWHSAFKPTHPQFHTLQPRAGRARKLRGLIFANLLTVPAWHELTKRNALLYSYVELVGRRDAMLLPDDELKRLTDSGFDKTFFESRLVPRMPDPDIEEPYSAIQINKDDWNRIVGAYPRTLSQGGVQLDLSQAVSHRSQLMGPNCEFFPNERWTSLWIEGDINAGRPIIVDYNGRKIELDALGLFLAPSLKLENGNINAEFEVWIDYIVDRRWPGNILLQALDLVRNQITPNLVQPLFSLKFHSQLLGLPPGIELIDVDLEIYDCAHEPTNRIELMYRTKGGK
jgi:hypothetical protein